MAQRIEHSDPVEAAKAALWKHERVGGVGHIADHVIRDVVDAVLATADTICTVRELCMREMWEHNERYREHVRTDLRCQLLDAVTGHGLIPTALPAEELRYTDWRHRIAGPDNAIPDGADIPAEAIEQGVDWTHVEVVLSVPVRMPLVAARGDTTEG